MSPFDPIVQMRATSNFGSRTYSLPGDGVTPTASFNTMGPVPEEGCETQAVTDVTLMRSTITEVG